MSLFSESHTPAQDTVTDREELRKSSGRERGESAIFIRVQGLGVAHEVRAFAL